MTAITVTIIILFLLMVFCLYKLFRYKQWRKKVDEFNDRFGKNGEIKPEHKEWFDNNYPVFNK